MQNRIFVSLALSIACGIAAQTPASAEERGTLEQQMACTPDVFRLCGAQIPDTNRIVACLRQNISQLSGPCQQVFDSNASMPPPAAPAPRPQSRNVRPAAPQPDPDSGDE